MLAYVGSKFLSRKKIKKHKKNYVIFIFIVNLKSPFLCVNSLIFLLTVKLLTFWLWINWLLTVNIFFKFGFPTMYSQHYFERHIQKRRRKIWKWFKFNINSKMFSFCKSLGKVSIKKKKTISCGHICKRRGGATKIVFYLFKPLRFRLNWNIKLLNLLQHCYLFFVKVSAKTWFSATIFLS